MASQPAVGCRHAGSMQVFHLDHRGSVSSNITRHSELTMSAQMQGPSFHRREKQRFPESGENLDTRTLGFVLDMNTKKSTWVLYTTEFVPLNWPEARSD